jgi:hypothetical protein
MPTNADHYPPEHEQREANSSGARCDVDRPGRHGSARRGTVSFIAKLGSG